MTTASPDPERPPDATSSDDGRGWTGTVLLALLAGVVLTVAITGPEPIRPWLLEPTQALWVRLLGLAVALAGLVVLRARAGRGAETGPGLPAAVSERSVTGRSAPALGALRSAATVMVVLALLATLTRPMVHRERPDRGSAASSGGWIDLPDRRSRNVLPAPTRGGTSTVRGSTLDGGAELGGITVSAERQAAEPGLLQRLAGRSLPLLLIILLLAAFFRTRKRREREHTFEITILDPAVPARELEASIEHALARLAPDAGDRRERILAAYRALLSALETAGASREPWEGPHEHLQRCLASLGVSAAELRRLASLYVLADYGDRPITEAHVRATGDALRAGLWQLSDARAHDPRSDGPSARGARAYAATHGAST